MKSFLKWNQYLFRHRPDEDKSIIIVAPTFVEAIQTYHQVSHIEPYSVQLIGSCYLSDSE